MGAIQRLHRAQMGVSGGGKYIKFADPEVLRVLLANGVSSDGVGITTADVEKVTSIGTWFKGNTEITSFDEFEKFTGVTSLSQQALYQCSALSSIKLPQGVTSITDGVSLGGVMKGGVFAECSSLSEFDCEGITAIGSAAFYSAPTRLINSDKVVSIGQWCFSLGGGGSVSLPSLDTFGNNAFSKSLVSEILDLGKVKSVGAAGTQNYGGYGAFYSSTNLTKLVFPSTIESVSSFSCSRCSSLYTVICNAINPPALGSSVFSSTPIASGTGYIYVPDASVDAYKSATNWATYESQIKPLSEYNE